MEKIIINSMRDTIENDSMGHLSLKYRVELMGKIGEVDIINKIYFECVKKNYNIWQSEYGYPSILDEVLYKIELYLYKKEGKNTDFVNIVSKTNNFFNSQASKILNLIGLSVISLCNSIIYDCAAILDIEDYNGEDDKEFDYDVWNPDFLSMMVYTGGNPFLSEGDIIKRKEFWNYFLDMILYITENPYKPFILITNPVFFIEKKSQVTLQRVQSYRTQEIEKLINEVIDRIINSANKNSDVWQNIKIEFRSMKIGIKSSIFKEDGQKIKRIDMNVLFILDKMRDLMYSQANNEGAWLQCFIDFNKNKDYQISFNYDNEDLLPEDIRSPDNFVYEFKNYPRSKDFTPIWWRHLLPRSTKYLK